MRYDALLFDNDGVILEWSATDRTTFEGAVRDAFSQCGVADPEPTDVGELVYGVTVSGLKATCERYGIDAEEFWKCRDQACSQVQRDAIASREKGLYPDVETLFDLSGPKGVVSTNQQSTLQFAYDNLDVPAFDVVQGRPPTVESLRRKKPSPYYIERTLNALEAEKALYVGDSEHDVVAARRAGIDAAFLRREHNRNTRLSVTPDYELDGLTALPSIVE